MSVKQNYKTIKQDIVDTCRRVGRDPDEVTTIAVTKYVTIDRANEAINAGITELGENRSDEFLNKYQAIGQAANWHFIGTLQSRKVKDVIDNVTMVHSLDRHSLAKEINKRTNRTIPCFVQVNTSGEDSKHGLEPEEVKLFIEQLSSYSNIKVVGLMTMAPLVEDESMIRKSFRSLKELRDDIQQLNLSFAPCQHLSMGMSHDFQIAIEEGATHIRIGSKLVGQD
ncbi:YggS family pyridoxal phosphate-dependent enzyme [Alkalibacillus salilacus]|uniref:Pyridoxal phosphate homeostasis protein n=1 Tax=Alkalibacillus salilacus TaxID=284582 RepID=A0ABT9VDW9_9BACI|nr:YggS family pyridoxal phosphate-dependent enzyme [Alkalibacillus salilacus]MDQ0159171.1 pyridoxal phosphate enzyme (YggS family) [Alkalibacillus salilacus]